MPIVSLQIGILLPMLMLGLSLTAGCNRGLGRGTPPPVSCTPACFDRDCGDDGCMGWCGECPEGRTCNVMVGRCVGGDEDLVTGRIEFEYRPGIIQPDGGVVLGDPEVLPARNMWAMVTDATGEVLGAREVLGDDGSFAVPVARALTGSERLVFSALWSRENEIRLAVLRRNPTFNPLDPLPVWAWTSQVPAGGDVGSITVGESDGSGAMFLYLINRRAQDSVLESVLASSDANLIHLAILWAPGASGICGACFSQDTSPIIKHDETVQLDLPTVQMRQSIFIDDGFGGSGAWGFPVLLHEFGHYVALNYSRDDSPGGPHYVGQKLSPPFAWSEGWASFFGAMTATQWFARPEPVYWDIQGGESFWIDFDSGMRWNGTSIGMPSLGAGPKQDLDESFVTMALWNLWEGRSGVELDDGSGLSADSIMKAVSSKRFRYNDRGFVAGSDLVDFLDSAACLDPSRAALLQGRSTDDLRFPWDGDPICAADEIARQPILAAAGQARGRPLPPLGIELQVDRQPAGLRVHARAVERGPMPGPVKLVVEWHGGQLEADSILAQSITSITVDGPPETTLTLPPDAGLITARASSRGHGWGAAAQASWPVSASQAPAAPKWIPIPRTTLSGVSIDTAVSLDP